jgi:hypothetical protein
MKSVQKEEELLRVEGLSVPLRAAHQEMTLLAWSACSLC